MRKAVATLVALFFLLYVAVLGVRPLFAPDETRYGEIPREILASGDWVVPHLNGVRYFEKPIMGHWLNAISLMMFGANEFAVRFPSALAAGLSALLLFVWARKYSEDQVIPLFAAAVFLLSFEVFGVGTFLVLDSILSLFMTGAIVAFFFAYQEPDARRRLGFLVLAGAACGCAFLTKGFLALVIPVSVMLPFALWNGCLMLCLRTAWIPVVTAVLVSLPWGLMIHRREPDFWHYFFWIEHVNRFISPSGGQHPAPFWYYVPVLFGGAMPWTPLLGPIVQGLRRTSWKHPMVRLAICWIVFPFLFFSACGGKLATYVLPCFPPLAFLIAVGVHNYLQAGKARGFIVGTWILVCVSALLLAALVVGLIVRPQLKDSVGLWPWTLVAAGVIAWGVLCRMAITASNVRNRLLLFSVAPMLFMLGVPFVAPAFAKTSKRPGELLLAQAAKIPPQGVIVTPSGLAATACWYYQRSDVFILGGKGEYAYGLGYEDSKHRVLDLEDFQRLLAQESGRTNVTLILNTKDYGRQAKLLPEPVFKVESQDLVFAQFAVTAGGTNRPTTVAPATDP